MLRDFQKVLDRRLREPLNFIQVVTGPRQVGKTTAVTSIFDKWDGPKHLVSADSPTPPNYEWVNLHFDVAEAKGPGTLLIIDEIQKVSSWSEVVKIRFDRIRKKRSLKVVVLGSANLSLQQGLSESLAGRYEVIHAPHWSYREMKQLFNWDLETYLAYGGYPAPAELIGDRERWRSFMQLSIIEPILSRDIQGITRIDKPALFRRAFEVAMNYPAQVISLQKFLGQLQEGGNVSTIKHYLELFEGAYLLKCLSKYSRGYATSRASSPKMLPLAPALISAFKDPMILKEDPTWRGRVFEAVVGAHLSRLPGELYYWSDGKFEVDFVREDDKSLTAYEIKSGLIDRTTGLTRFKEKYPQAKIEVIDFAKARELLG
jgi:predicted AAA+ superfamily ATPase